MTSPSDTLAAPDVGEITREWFERKVALEGDLEIGAGVRGKRTMTLTLTPEELAALEALAGPDWKARALTAEAALASSAAETARLRGERDQMWEAGAKAVYEQWAAQPGYVAWVPGGNSLKQCEARVLVRKAFSALETKGGNK